MGQLLPLLLDWLSVTPDPDLGLLGLRTLVVRSHHRALVVTTFRESPEAARRLCLMLGSSLAMAEAIERNPELIADLDDDDALAPARAGRPGGRGHRAGPARPGDDGRRRARLVRLTQDQMLRIATRDLLDIDDIASTGAALTDVAEAVLEAAVDHVGPRHRLLRRGSWADWAGPRCPTPAISTCSSSSTTRRPTDHDRGEEAAEALLRFVHGPSPVATGGHRRPGPTSRGRPGPPGPRPGRLPDVLRTVGPDLGAPGPAPGPGGGRRPRTSASASWPWSHAFVWDRPLTDDEVADIRRMKARIERERIPPREDPQFHLKLGRGSLSDIEWTAQLLQLRHGVSATGTMAALDALAGQGCLAPVRRRDPRPRLPFPRAHPQPLAPGRRPCPGGPRRATPCPPRPTSSRIWPAASEPLRLRCATSTAGSPAGPGGWSNASSTGSTGA